MKQWSIIENESQYKVAKERFEEIYDVDKKSSQFTEMSLLALLINQYEKQKFTFPSVDPVEMIKIRMEEFGYKPTDLAEAYGDKGTISKMLNYKQPLSLNAIRVFSKLLRIPADALIAEYPLKQS